MYLDNTDVNLVTLQIRSTPIGARLSCPATMLLNKPIRSLLPEMNRKPLNINNDDAQ